MGISEPVRIDMGVSQADAGEIRSIEEYEQVFHHDLSKPRLWEAWNGEKWVPVELPAFAGRSKERRAYVEEFTEAGFKIDRIYEAGSGRQFLDFILGKAD